MNLLELFGKIKTGHTLDLVFDLYDLDDLTEMTHVFSSKPFTIHSELQFVSLQEVKAEIVINGVVYHYFFELALLTDVIDESKKPAHQSKTDKQLAEILLVFADVT